MTVVKRTRTSKRTSRKTTYYEAQVYARGVRVATKSFDTRAAAEVWHDETKRRFRLGATNLVSETTTFGDCFERYKVERIPQLRPQTQQTTANRFRYIADSPLIPFKMCDISDKSIDEWFAWLRAHPTAQNSGRRNFKQEFQLLRAILHWYRDHMDAKFVVPIVKRHRQQVTFKAVAPRRPDYYMRPEQVNAWLDWLKTHRTNSAYYRLATFLVYTSARVGEDAGLCWDAVDLENRIASVIRTVWWDHHTKAPQIQETAKTESSIRVLRLSGNVLTMLREMRAESTGVGPVFTDKKGGLLRYPAIQNAFNAGFIALNLPWRSTHICRHSYGTLALVAGRNLSSVQAAMGHKNIRETEGYAKNVALMTGETTDKVAELIEGTGPKKGRERRL